MKEGVYEARTEVEGREYKCIANFGSRPTFGDERVLTETYFDGFSGRSVRQDDRGEIYPISFAA